MKNWQFLALQLLLLAILMALLHSGCTKPALAKDSNSYFLDCNKTPELCNDSAMISLKDSDFIFTNPSGNEALKISKGKFFAEGKEIKDVNKIYERFSDFMNHVCPTYKECSCESRSK